MRLRAVCLDDSESPGQSVLLPAGASYEAVESALSSIGVFAPRGLDTLEWTLREVVAAVICDGNGVPIVALIDAQAVQSKVRTLSKK